MFLRHYWVNSGATNGGTPGAFTFTGAQPGDLKLYFFYGRAAGGNETVTWDASFVDVFNSVTAGSGLWAVAQRVHQAGDSDLTPAIANFTSGETILFAGMLMRGAYGAAPIGSYTASLSTWTSSTTLGSIVAPSSATLAPGDAVIVAGARFENVTGITTLTGDNLTWVQPHVASAFNSTSGSDAGGSIQIGYNRTPVNQTITDKSISTTGTTQVGSGRMFTVIHDPASTLDVIGAGMIPYVY